ncbi:hypothetical protein GCM10020331_103110 [Ectobacillus funiculus]
MTCLSWFSINSFKDLFQISHHIDNNKYYKKITYMYPKETITAPIITLSPIEEILDNMTKG